MLSKCANPECSEVFRYLHQGKLFLLSPTREVEIVTGHACPSLYERFWLCDSCSKQMTVVWGGKQMKLVRLPPQAKPPGKVALWPDSEREVSRGRFRGRVASSGGDDW